MSGSVSRSVVSSEVNQVERPRMARAELVNKVERVESAPIDSAKASVGAAIQAAIGDAPMKTYGDKALMSGLCSGEKVPEYLANIYRDEDARRRLGLELLKGTCVTVETVVRWHERIE